MPRFRTWFVLACAFGALACGGNGRDPQSRRAASGLQVDESTPIGKKWVKLGGAAVVGEPTTDVLSTPNGSAQYQRFANGVIVFSQDWGAIYDSGPIFDAWLGLVGQTSATGEELFGYVGPPILDFTVDGSVQRGIFERGMIVADPGAGTAFLVSGPIYLHWWDVKGVGLPVAAEEAVPSGRRQLFQNGEIHWKPSTGAFAVQGAILDRWNALGGSGGALGFPLSDELPTAGTGPAGRTSRFENGAIYWTAATGAWELMGDLRKAYEDRFGGPAGWLGFPVSGQTSTPTSGGTYNDFENGVVVSHASGPYQGTYAFNRLQLFVQRIAGFGDDCVFGICGSQDVYAFFKVTTSTAGVVKNVRIPGSGDGGADFEIDQT
jgi:uncharacterized protein with LGFP repeats